MKLKRPVWSYFNVLLTFSFMLLSLRDFELPTCSGGSITSNLYALNVIDCFLGGHPLACNNMYLLCHMTRLQNCNGRIILFIFVFA